MENKYYTPKKEELSIGFELEIENLNKEGSGSWCDEKIPYGACIDQLFEDDSLDIRVKYLDQKDLLELGWSEHPKSTEFTVEAGFWRVRIVNKGEIELDYEDNVDWEASFTLYKCKVKNKSEMRKLMHMLNIKKD